MSEVNGIDKVNMHKQICDELTDTYARKNQDYGNSFSEQFEEYGLKSSAIRLDDKIRRFKQIIENPEDIQVKSESIEDTLLDLANYSIMTVMELRKDLQE